MNMYREVLYLDNKGLSMLRISEGHSMRLGDHLHRFSPVISSVGSGNLKPYFQLFVNYNFQTKFYTVYTSGVQSRSSVH